MSFVIIASPAKKMVAEDAGVYERTRPQFLEEARELALELRLRGREGAQEVWRCSDRLASENWERLLTLPEDMMRDPRALASAVTSYRGIQYTSLAPEVMDSVQLTWLARHLRIVSGLYGLLRPSDGVLPYRLEMQARLSVGGSRDLYEWWDSRIMDALACETGVRHIVNVASKEYAKAVLPHALEGGPAIITCLFGEVGPGGRLKQRATEAKAARGTFVRWAAERCVRDVNELRLFDERGYHLDEGRSDGGTWTFVRER